jgi:subtilisin-like proprotein convertase family protein
MVIAGLTLGGAAMAAKKKKKKAKIGGTVDITQPVNTAIPDATATQFGTLPSTISVATKQFRGAKIRDVNVTVTTLGATGATPADNLQFRLTAPDGTTTWLVGNVSGPLAGVNIGPLTFDDEVAANLGGLPPAPDSLTLVSPYIGTAQPHCFSSFGVCTLAAMDDGNVSGTWRLTVQDADTTGETSILASWRLVAVAGKPYKTK